MKRIYFEPSINILFCYNDVLMDSATQPDFYSIINPWEESENE